jgi:hypothetical protein
MSALHISLATFRAVIVEAMHRLGGVLATRLQVRIKARKAFQRVSGRQERGKIVNRRRVRGDDRKYLRAAKGRGWCLRSRRSHRARAWFRRGTERWGRTERWGQRSLCQGPSDGDSHLSVKIEETAKGTLSKLDVPWATLKSVFAEALGTAMTKSFVRP